MRISDPFQLATGMEIFCVNGFSGSKYACNVIKYEVLQVSISSGNKNSTGGNNWMEVKRMDFDQGATTLSFDGQLWHQRANTFYRGRTEITSMQDAGIIPNTYNKHQAFTSLAEAMLYGEGKLSLEEICEAPAKTEEPCDYDRAMKVVSW